MIPCAATGSPGNFAGQAQPFQYGIVAEGRALLDFDFVSTGAAQLPSQAVVHCQTELHATCPATHNRNLPG